MDSELYSVKLVILLLADYTLRAPKETFHAVNTDGVNEDVSRSDLF